MQENNIPILSIVIPNWNGGKYLCDMVDSILAQTFRDWRLFIVDDQSTDNSAELIAPYCERDSRVHFVVRDREPKGAQTCRNTGVELSEGSKYVIIFDSDDLIAPFCFEQRVAFMEDHPDLDWGIFPAKTFSYDTNERPIRIYGEKLYSDHLLCFFTRTLEMVGWTNIYRLSSYKKLGFNWDEKIMSRQDSDFNIQNILKGAKYDFAADAEFDYFYRIGSSKIGSISQMMSKDMKHAPSHVYLLDKIFRTLPDEFKAKHDKKLLIYALNYIEKVQWDKGFTNKIIQIPWVNTHTFFCILVKLVLYTSPVFAKVVFHSLRKAEYNELKSWSDKIEDIINERYK